MKYREALHQLKRMSVLPIVECRVGHLVGL